MHICYLTGEYPIPGRPHGGIGTFIKAIAENLSQKNIIVSVISIDNQCKKEYTQNKGLLTIHFLPASKWPVLKFMDHSMRYNNTLKRIHKQNPIDLIEGHEISFAFINKIESICFLIRMNGGHHFFSKAENRAINKKTAKKERMSFAKSDAFIAVSKYTNVETARYLDYDSSATAIIPNGIDINKFKAGSLDEIVPGRILFVGTVVEKKGIRQLIMALPQILQQHPNVELKILGNLQVKDKKTGGLYMDYLQQFIPPAVKHAIHFIGFVDNEKLQNYIRSAEICVFPSHMETQGIVAAESMVMEKLTIFGKDGPGPEVIDDKITGLLCDPHSPEDIAEKVIYALSHPEECRKMAKKAREVAIERYDAEKLAQVNIDFYTKAIADHKASLSK